MTVVRPVCPNCGGNLYQDKGAGAVDPVPIAEIHLRALQMLKMICAFDEDSAAPMYYVRKELAWRGMNLSSGTVSGRLSELKGMGYSDFVMKPLTEWNPETHRTEFGVKPFHWITPKGLELLKEKVIAK
jgi:hypothetical protein